MNISSAGAVKGFPLQTPYTAAKYGVVGLTLALANESAAQNVRVNAVLPTGCPTGMIPPSFGVALGEERPDLIPIFVNAMPTPAVEPVDVSNAVLFLLSDGVQMGDGAALAVQGGRRGDHQLIRYTCQLLGSEMRRVGAGGSGCPSEVDIASRIRAT